MSHNQDPRKSSTAGLFAALHGDAEHAFMSSDDIERQEAEGQQAVVATQRLPRRNEVASQLEALGFKLIGPAQGEAGELFAEWAFPAGWRNEATDHHMWNRLVDPQGRTRATWFYKAAWYDRDAFLTHLRTRYQAQLDAERLPSQNTERHSLYCVVVDQATGQTLWETAYDYRPGEWDHNRAEEKRARIEALAWLDERYPDHRDPLKYWE